MPRPSPGFWATIRRISARWWPKATAGLLGLTHYLFHRHAWKIENVCYLQDLFVDPAARGTGLGRKP
jgi:GNAT superfamily N-acetyltransferase